MIVVRISHLKYQIMIREKFYQNGTFLQDFVQITVPVGQSLSLGGHITFLSRSYSILPRNDPHSFCNIGASRIHRNSFHSYLSSPRRTQSQLKLVCADND